MKVLLSVFVVAFIAKVDSQHPLPIIQFDMDEFMAHQQQHHAQINHEQARQMEAEEPMVGSPLLPLLPLKHAIGMPFGLHHHLGGLIPGMRLSNFQAGNIGGLKYGKMLLGAENPMAEEGEGEEAILGKKKKKKWYKFAEPSLGDVQHYQAEPQHYQLDPSVAAPPPQQEFLHHHWFLNEEVGAPHQNCPMNQQHQVAAPQQHYHFQELAAAPQQHYQIQEVGAAPQHFELQPLQPVGPPVPQSFIPQHQEMVPQPHAEEGARHFDKWFKGDDDDYGYGYGDSYG